MRILHTADLHLGRQFNGISLEQDHDAILGQILDALVSRNAGVLVIAGDIFDRAAPPATAVRQFNMFLTEVASRSSAAVVMIAGNHDSGDRIAAMSIMTDTRRALIRGAVSATETPLILQDAAGPVAFTGLPFAYEHAARECFGDDTLQSPEDVLRAQINAARASLPENTRWVAVAHGFVAGASSSEGERPLTRIGGIETVSADVFEGAHYVALGHLHRPQEAGAPHIRYSGSPLAFGFDEAGSVKSMSLVELDAEGRIAVEEIPFTPLRRVRELTGTHAQLLQMEPSEDFIRAVLNDETPVIDGMKRLREVFPNACELVYARRERAPEIKQAGGHSRAIADPLTVTGDFLEHVRGSRLSAEELEVVSASLNALREKEDAQ